MPEANKKPTITNAQATLKMAAHFKKIANSPLKKKGTNDAWNERQNRLAAARDSVKLLIRGTMELNQAKRALKKKANSGAKSSE